MRVILACLTLAALGCGRAEDGPDAQTVVRRGPASEPISLRMGEREVRVHCGVECHEVTSELARLHAGCLTDPMSTPHHVTSDAPLLSLGCCTEARAAYEQACGVEGAAECASAWGARCESGHPTEGGP